MKFRLRPGSVARAEDMLTACVRECAAYLATGPTHAGLVAAVGALVVEHSDHEPSAERAFDAVLKVGRAALDAGEVRLARRVADSAVALRNSSKGAWRLRGEALEADGREHEAIEAYERYQALAGGGTEEVARRLTLLRHKRAALVEAGRIVSDALLAERPAPEAKAALTGAVERELAGRGAADPGMRALAGAFGSYARLSVEAPMEDPLLGGSEPIGVGDFRAQVKGRRVCVVANGEELAGRGLGKEIDSYDLVIRLDSFQTHPAGTGERVDVHAVSHRSGGPGWRRQVDTRLVFGEKPSEWREAIRSRLVPGAQRRVGDRSLSRPVRDPALIGESRWAVDAGTGFTVARLLDFLDVSPAIDLFGFALPGQLRPEERQWVLSHARGVDGVRISLR
ncbi:bacterial transcriptional activator domain-containing protein [Streptomyces hoynatensis]|nr:bacterial transcriptional activator domain-containing protein [Streptomyces hoynatensis]